MASSTIHVVDPPHPAALSDEALLKQCEIGFGRDSGPGGQHRNKVETAVRILHKPTGIEAAASERRKQFENRVMALKRLRLKLAVTIRTKINVRGYRRSELWESRRQGTKFPINPEHRDYPAILAEALDVVHAKRFDVAGSAGLLGISMSQLAKLMRHHKQAYAEVNAGREAIGLHPLR